MTVGKWILIASGIVIMTAVIAVFVGQSRENSRADALVETLVQSLFRPATGTVDFESLATLPPPVARYFKHVLAENQNLIKTARMHQSGVLRTSTTTDAWSSFTASQIVAPPVIGFVWNAKVETPLATHVRVLDSYVAGIGAGRFSILSAFAVASEAGEPELNSGALHRYLAEAVWYPTALLPQSGVTWTPINEYSAMAAITDRGTTVSLEFRFNDVGEVVAIYSPGRFGRFDAAYKQVPWEGHFSDYKLRGGMRIPAYGEVGWYEGQTLQLVWRGNLIDVRYQLSH